MIKIMRNMSKKELDLLLSGMIIEGRKKYTSSTSHQEPRVCFFSADDKRAYQVLHNWNHEVIVFFEADESILKEDYGRYPDYNSPYHTDTVWLKEYYVKEYSKESIRPLYWKWQHDYTLFSIS